LLAVKNYSVFMLRQGKRGQGGTVESICSWSWFWRWVRSFTPDLILTWMNSMESGILFMGDTC